jgi:DNA-binding SARP family transcriptional activator
MEFGLLGPLEVHRQGVLLPVPHGKQRAILAVLLMRSDQVVAADELMDLIWDGAPPRAARPALHNYVKRLRKALGPDGHVRIRTAEPGYLIQLTPGELDLARFAALCAAGREAMARQDWNHACAQFGAALALWRGYPLIDIECPRLTIGAIPHLLEQKTLALEDRIDADLHLGRHRQVIPELQQLAGAEPLRERFCALLMLALYRTGRQAEALAVYRTARQGLIREIGVEPGTELRQLHHRILTADPGLDPTPLVLS